MKILTPKKRGNVIKFVSRLRRELIKNGMLVRVHFRANEVVIKSLEPTLINIGKELFSTDFTIIISCNNENVNSVNFKLGGELFSFDGLIEIQQRKIILHER